MNTLIKYLNKNDIIHYLKFGPMDFPYKQSMFYYFIIEFPIYSIVYWFLYIIKTL